MTLLELLRQELPKRGGWPKGADYVVQDGDGSNDVKFGAGETTVEFDDRMTWVNNIDPEWGIDTVESYIRGIATLADDHATAIVTREQYEATGWDGTGLPPVGVECEYSRQPGEADSFGSAWKRCFIRYASFRTVVIQTHNDELSGHPSKFNFRPLRTEAERAIDEMVQLSGVSTGAAKILYDAGYRKG